VTTVIGEVNFQRFAAAGPDGWPRLSSLSALRLDLSASFTVASAHRAAQASVH
jgi:hypothetical protein